jgi:hypothetical protein
LCWSGDDQPGPLIARATSWLVVNKVLLPGVSVLERFVGRIRDRAQKRLWKRLVAALDDKLSIGVEYFSGLRWLSLAVMLPVPFAGRRWALPFLTVLAPSARWSEAQGRRHKALTEWARQAILQTKRWLPDRRVVVVADSGFSALEFIAAVRRHVCLITRLRLDASLFEPAPKRRKGQMGRTALKGKRRPKLNAVCRSSSCSSALG